MVVQVLSRVRHMDAEQALSCVSHKVDIPLCFPEDFGGHASAGSSSSWRQKDTAFLCRFTEAKRHAIFVCRFSGGNKRRPLGILSSMLTFNNDSSRDWPGFQKSREDLGYHVRLSKMCPCWKQHLLTTGRASAETFNTSFSASLGASFGIASSFLGHLF